MRMEDCYRLLDLQPGATDDEIKQAWRDLTKVWHPDRFAHDPSMRGKAEEKLKAINDAYETLRGQRGESGERWPVADEEPESQEVRARRRLKRYRAWAIALALAALFILMRRPTFAGLLIAGLLWCGTIVLIVQMRRS